MEKYIKKYFCTINLFTIAICSFLAAKSANFFVGAYILSAPDQTQKTASVKPDSSMMKNQQKTIHKAKKDPFQNIELNPLDVIEENPEFLKAISEIPNDTTDYKSEMECSATSIPGTIMGTIVSSDPEGSAVIIQGNDQKVKMFDVGHQIQAGATIVAVFRKKVFINNNGRIECLFHGDQQKKLKKEPVPSEAGEGIKNVGGNSYVISNDEKERALGDMAQLATQARIVPSFKNGQSNGFRIYSIKPGSLYQKIGIKNGDIIQRINELDINSPEKALEIYSKLKDEDRVNIDILRRGSKVTLDYTFQ